MRYIIYDNKQIVGTYEQDSSSVTLGYPGYKTQSIEVDNDLWEKLKQTPEKYIYKDGKVVLLQP